MNIKFTLNLFFLLSLPGLILSQNLVPNPSFEIYSACPNNYNEIEYATGWHTSHVNNCCGANTDYANVCGTGGFSVPSNVWGYQMPSTGNAYQCQVTMDLGTAANYRENMYAKLDSPLKKGSWYYLSVKICHTNASQYSTNNYGLKFSTDTTMAVDNIQALYETNIITDTVNWTTVEGCYQADSNYLYIGAGNFFDDAHTSYVKNCPTCPHPHFCYFVDDVSVMPISVSGKDTICSEGHSILSASGGISYLWSPGGQTTDSITVSPAVTTTYSVQITTPTCTIDTAFKVTVLSCEGIPGITDYGKFEIYPNPSNGIFNFSYDSKLSGAIKLNILDLPGRILQTNLLNGNTGLLNLDECRLSNGIYFYQIIRGDLMISNGKFIIAK